MCKGVEIPSARHRGRNVLHGPGKFSELPGSDDEKGVLSSQVISRTLRPS